MDIQVWSFMENMLILKSNQNNRYIIWEYFIYARARVRDTDWLIARQVSITSLHYQTKLPQLPSGKERGLELGGKMEKNNGGCANKAVGLGGESCCGCHFSFGLVLHTQQHMLTIS